MSATTIGDGARYELLGALLASPTGTASLGELSGEHDAPFADGGGLRRGGAILALARDGLIESVGAARSRRPSRHRGLVTRWRIVDREGCHRLWRHLHDRLADPGGGAPKKADSNAPTSEPAESADATPSLAAPTPPRQRMLDLGGEVRP